jgi:hypothetical protein
MKNISLKLILAGAVLSAATSWGQVIPVSTFGPIINTDLTTFTQGQSFGQGNGWTVTGPATSSIDLVYEVGGGGGWVSPDGLATVDLDGNTVGQIKTTINVPGVGPEALTFTSLDGTLGGPGNAGAVIGTVTASEAASVVAVSFFLSGNPLGPPVTKELSVTLGNSAPQVFDYTVTGNQFSMDYITKTLDFTASTSVPDDGATVVLLGLAFIGLALYRRPSSCKA